MRNVSQNVAERTVSTEVVPTDALESQVETVCNLRVTTPCLIDGPTAVVSIPQKCGGMDYEE